MIAFARLVNGTENIRNIYIYMRYIFHDSTLPVVRKHNAFNISQKAGTPWFQFSSMPWIFWIMYTFSIVSFQAECNVKYAWYIVTTSNKSLVGFVGNICFVSTCSQVLLTRFQRCVVALTTLYVNRKWNISFLAFIL